MDITSYPTASTISYVKLNNLLLDEFQQSAFFEIAANLFGNPFAGYVVCGLLFLI